MIKIKTKSNVKQHKYLRSINAHQTIQQPLGIPKAIYKISQNDCVGGNVSKKQHTLDS